MISSFFIGCMNFISLACKLILPSLFVLLDPYLISPFIGGGSLESRWASEWGIPVYGYDIFDALVNFWNVLLSSPNELADKLQKLSPTKE